LSELFDLDIWHASSCEGPGDRSKSTVTERKCFFFAYGCTLPGEVWILNRQRAAANVRATQHNYLERLVCRVVCAEVIDATSTEGFLVDYAKFINSTIRTPVLEIW